LFTSLLYKDSWISMQKTQCTNLKVWEEDWL
jgi:hypothetical protein